MTVSFIRSSATLRVLLAATLASWMSAAASGSSQAPCPEVAQALRAALTARDLDGARRRFEAVLAEPACSDAFRARAGRAVSMLHARVVQERSARGSSLASQLALLHQGLRYARTWPILALLGDAARDAGDHDGASAWYQEALVAIDDSATTPKPPAVPVIERLFRRAAQSRLLATHYQPPPKTRSGAPGGLAAERIRGFVVARVPVPITFHTDSAEFTDMGRRAASDMAEYLTAQQPARVTIAGHTDPRGEDAYNLALSRRRAEAVARFLREHGFTGQVEVVAKGEREPFSANGPGTYTRAQRWQMDRRVELIR